VRATPALPGRLALVLLAVLVCPAVARAQVCTVTTPGLNFGSYDVFAATTPILTTTITLNCTGKPFPKDLSITVQLGGGNSGDFYNRYMSNGSGDHLLYKLCLNATCTTLWGNGPGHEVIQPYAKTQAGTNVPVTVYGQINAQQDVRGGPPAYTDQVTVTILY
jgi:spore coat protein U-like protein